jgi:hypothetical protein
MSLSLNYPTISPSLLLDFANSGRLDPQVTFTRSSTATFFDETGVLRTANNDVPRFDYNPVTLAAQGLLIEESRTNLLTYSDDFADASWTKTRATITSNATSAPDGTTNGDHLVEDATPANSHFITAISTSFVSNTIYNCSIFVKSDGSGRRLQIAFPNTAFGLTTRVNFNVDTQTVTAGTNSTGSITSVGGGWYRCAATMTATATASTAIFFSLANTDASSLAAATYNGDGTSGIFIWGAQLEAGAFPTSYIPTTTTALTRAADVASVNTLSPWFNAAEGTLYVQASVGSAAATAIRLAAIDDGTTGNVIRFASGTLSFQVLLSSATQANLVVVSLVDNIPAKIAGAYKLNDFAASANGGAALTDTAGTIPVVDRLVLGAASGVSPKQTWIQRFTYYPVRLSNAQLQAITA